MKQLLLFGLTAVFCYSSYSQYDAKPSRSRFYNSKFSTFDISPRDTLVYTISRGDSSFEYIAGIEKYGDEINFAYKIPQWQASGNITVEALAVKEAVKYDTIDSNESNLKDKSVLWLSKKNYTELQTEKVTSMDMGNGPKSYERKSTSTFKIKYKGKEKIITVYNIESSNQAAAKKLAVLNSASNPLIINVENGWTMTLKEVR